MKFRSKWVHEMVSLLSNFAIYPPFLRIRKIFHLPLPEVHGMGNYDDVIHGQMDMQIVQRSMAILPSITAVVFWDAMNTSKLLTRKLMASFPQMWKMLRSSPNVFVQLFVHVVCAFFFFLCKNVTKYRPVKKSKRGGSKRKRNKIAQAHLWQEEQVYSI